MLNCPKCREKKVVKNGFVKGLQRFKCNSCGLNFTKNFLKYIDNLKKNDNFRRLALHMRIDGMRITDIARTLDSNRTTVRRWIDEESRKLRKSKVSANWFGQGNLNKEYLAEYINKKENISSCFYIIEFPQPYDWHEDASFIAYLRF